MANTISVSVLADVKDIRSKLGSVDKQLSGFGKATSRIGGLIAGAFAGTAVIGGIKKMVSSASDLNETISKTQTIFGKASPGILKFGDNAAKSLGLSKQAALDGVSSFGNFFNQIGIGTKQSANLSKSFVTMASDLASFNNAAPTDVMDALSAATRGEYDSLQKFIPTINAAKVEQEALRESGKKSAKDLTDQDKALALHTLAVKGMGKAQGDFKRTSGGLANQQRILKAQFDNVVATLGTKLLPIATKIAQFMTGNLGPALKQVGDFVKSNVVPAIGDLVNWFKKYQDIIVPIAGAVLAMVAAYKVYTTTVAIVQAVQKAWIAVQAALNVVMSANPIGIIILALIGLAAAIVIAYKKSETFRDIINGAWTTIKTVTLAVFNAVKAFIIQVWTDIKTTVTGAVNGVKATVSAVWNAIKASTSAVWNGIKAVVSAVLGAVKAVVSAYFNTYKSLITGAWNVIRSSTSAVFNALRGIVSGALGNVMDLVRGLKGRVTGAFGGAVGWLHSAGVNIIQGLINGIKAMASNAAGAAMDVVKGAISKAKGILGIHSPSTVFAQIGRFTVQGLAKGLANKSELAKVSTAAGRMTTAIGTGFDSPSLALDVSGSGSAGTGNTYAITVNVPVNANPVATGKAITDAIKAYESAGGRR